MTVYAPADRRSRWPSSRCHRRRDLHRRRVMHSSPDDVIADPACNQRKPVWDEAHPENRWRVFTYEELVARDKPRHLLAEGQEPGGRSESAGSARAGRGIADDLRSALEQTESMHGISSSEPLW